MIKKAILGPILLPGSSWPGCPAQHYNVCQQYYSAVLRLRREAYQAYRGAYILTHQVVGDTALDIR
jgi:hypothetical protein